MNNIFYISDLHIGHKNIAKRRGFGSIQEHDQYIFHKWNETVSINDTVYILGDLTMDSGDYKWLAKLNGEKIVILGNHDKWKHTKLLLPFVKGLSGGFKFRHNAKSILFTHYPVHPFELQFVDINIHGHIHDNIIGDDRYINLSAEVIDYTPLTIEQIIKH